MRMRIRAIPCGQWDRSCCGDTLTTRMNVERSAHYVQALPDATDAQSCRLLQRLALLDGEAALGELAGLGEQGAHGLVPGRRSELDPRERKGDGGQVLRRLIVKLARDPPPLRLLGAEQPPGEDVQRAGATLDRGDVPVHD